MKTIEDKLLESLREISLNGEIRLPDEVFSIKNVELTHWTIDGWGLGDPELSLTLHMTPIIKTDYDKMLEKVPEIGQEIWR